MEAGGMIRRELLRRGAAFAITGALAMTGCTQPRRGAGDNGPSASLPDRGEYLVRGATVLSLDPKVGDLAQGDVHIRDGAIVAVAASIAAPPGATVIDASGMICMPGFVDTHWHLWTTVCRPVMRIDDADGRPIAVLVNYAAHPTILAWDNRLLSPDYPGTLRRTVESITGATCLFLQGAAGDQDTLRDYSCKIDDARWIGKQVGIEAARVAELIETQPTRLAIGHFVESSWTMGVAQFAVLLAGSS